LRFQKFTEFYNTCFISGVPHPYGISQLNNSLFWSDWKKHGIFKINTKVTSLPYKIRNSRLTDFDVKVFHSSKQPKGWYLRIITIYSYIVSFLQEELFENETGID